MAYLSGERSWPNDVTIHVLGEPTSESHVKGTVLLIHINPQLDISPRMLSTLWSPQVVSRWSGITEKLATCPNHQQATTR